jgi:hypothetical protein
MEIVSGVRWPIAALGAVLLVGGTAAGALPGAPAAPPPRTFGDEIILAADFHVHVFPGDGAVLPWDRAREARRRGLDVIGITAHNQMIGIDKTRPLETPFGVLLVPGEEITMPTAHIAAIGLEHDLSWRGSIAEVVAAIHAAGGVAIAAHPTEAQRATWTDDDFRIVDGVEAAHPMAYADRRDAADLASAYAQATAAHPGIAAIGSSDDHTGEPIGLCRTYVFVRSTGVPGVLDAIRRGRTVACDAMGKTTGPADLSAAVADACRTDAAAGQSTPTAARVATGVGWLGLLLLAFFAFG